MDDQDPTREVDPAVRRAGMSFYDEVGNLRERCGRPGGCSKGTATCCSVPCAHVGGTPLLAMRMAPDAFDQALAKPTKKCIFEHF